MSVITNVGIVGAGTMGSRIAGQCVLYGKEVYLFDTSAQALERALEQNREWLSEETDQERAEKALSRLHICSSLEECVASVELVLENVSITIECLQQVPSPIEGEIATRPLTTTFENIEPLS